MLTHETLTPAVAQVHSIIRQWQQSDTLTARASLYDPLAAAVDELASMVDTDSAHPDCWQLVLEADELATRARAWLDSVGVMAPEVVQAATAAAEAAEPDQPEELPSMEAMREQGASLANIAQRYRWFAVDHNGETIPDVGRVAVALADPAASRCPGPDPRTLRDQLAVESKWEARRCARRGVQPKRCKESVEQLLEQGVGIKQIQKMTGKTPGEIEAVARELGRIADPDRQEKPSRFAPSPEVLLDRIDSHQELGLDLRARVLAMAADGHRPGTIVQVCHRNGFREASLRLLESWLKPEAEKASTASE